MISGIFANRNDAVGAVEELKTKGYTNDISLVAKDISGQVQEEVAKSDDVAAGTVAGAIVGGLTGILAGVSSVVVPGVGPTLVAGPFVAAWGVTGAAVGALTGGLLEALVDLGLSEDVARTYEGRIKSGDALVAVTTDGGRETNVEKILKKHHAEEILIV